MIIFMNYEISRIKVVYNIYDLHKMLIVNKNKEIM